MSHFPSSLSLRPSALQGTRAGVHRTAADTMIKKQSEPLFSYGTLRYKDVQLSTFGRVLEGHAGMLRGYKVTTLSITNPEVVAVSGELEHPVAEFTGNPKDFVEGRVFYLTPVELAKSDEYESADYQRIKVTLHSGQQAWTYIAKT